MMVVGDDDVGDSGCSKTFKILVYTRYKSAIKV